MSSLAILIPVSLVMGLIGLCAFIWATRANQFEDLKGNAWRVIAPNNLLTDDNYSEKEAQRHDTLADHTNDPDPAGGL